MGRGTRSVSFVVTPEPNRCRLAWPGLPACLPACVSGWAPRKHELPLAARPNAVRPRQLRTQWA